uniref:protein-serine/threonine phosphatase n=1 Tax=Zeugodacus cucurbitae TaxID=28588 RepID=A0A0A1X7G8_ZEUCU
MGAYLSEPKTDKVSTDESNDILTVGASSMQGWRNNQEDAHNSILNFDGNTSFFAVYDGHGGAEVATYCADKLPQFLKELSTYKGGEFEKALKEAFLGFDKTLLEPQVVEILKVLAGEKGFDGDDSDAHEDDEDFEDLAELHEESHLPLDEVLEKYKGGPCMPSLKRVKDGATGSKPQSPYLRGRRAAAVIADATNKAVLDPESKPEGSSTSAAASAAALSGESGASSSHKPAVGTSSKTESITSESGPSSSNSGNAAKMDTDEPEEDSTVSSSSSSASKPTNNISAEVENNKPESNREKNSANGPAATLATDSATSSENNKEVCPDSSHTKEVEQNGSVSSSEKKPIKKQNSAAADMDTTVSGSNDAAKRIQNGTIGSTSAANKQVAGSTAITSTSKESKKLKKTVSGEEESTDDDADYEENAEEGDAKHSLVYSSEDEEVEEAENSSVYSSDEEVEEEEEEDEETALANEQFCADMIEEPGKDSGCTAVVALLNGRDLYVANAGDSRCVVCRNGKAIDMSLDHKPEDEEESSRIIKAGGRVTLDGRVNGGLNLSRAIGDHAYKMNLELPAEAQMISALPDVRKLIITAEDEFMVLACDGIWNYLSSEEVVDFVRQRLKDDSKKISQICEELFDTCLAPNTIGDGTGCDNMTAVIVRFESKILELPTKLKPEEIVLIKDIAAKTSNTNACAQKNEQPCLKRAASPSSDDNSNEAENANKTKRLKTDEETTSTTNTNKTTGETTACSNSDAAASSSSSEAAAAVASITEQKDCDSNTTACSNDAADTDNIAVSST